MSKTKYPIMLVALIALGWWAAVTGPHVGAAPIRQPDMPLTRQDLENAEYRTQYTPSRTVQLTDGVYEEAESGLRITLTEHYTFGDLNGDGAADAAAILATTLNNREPFLNLVALINGPEETEIGGFVLVGEHIQINELSIVNGKLSVDYLRPQPGDAVDSPSRQVTQSYFSRRGLLVPEQTRSFGQLFPYQDGTLYGYANVLGELVIEPQFMLAGEFTEGMAPVSYDGRTTGFINQIGELVIEPRFSYAGNFTQGLALVGVPGVDADAPFLTTYIDRIGRFVFGDARFFAAEPFSEGLAAVSYDGAQYGYIDLRGELAIELQFAHAEAFSEGLAPVQFGGQYGFIDRAGKFVITPQFETAKPFQDGLAQVVLGGKTGYVNQRGEMIIEPTFDYGNDFAEGRALVVSDGNPFYIDSAGNVAIELPDITRGTAFAEGLAAVVSNDLYGYIDLQGNLIVPPQFTYASAFKNGLAVVETAKTWGLINSVGEVVLEIDRALAQQPTMRALAMQKSATPQTQLIAYSPPIPTEIRSGTCSSNSELLALASAWKCKVTDGDTFDPCLTAADGETLVCAPSPMENYPGFQLDLTRPLPEVVVIAQPPSDLWLIQTDDDARCRVNRASNLRTDDKLVTHICADGMALLGDIDRNSDLWTVERGTLVNNAEGVLSIENVQRVGIVRAWSPVTPE